MKIRGHRYHWPLPSGLSRAHQGDGMLLAVDVDGVTGYADLHPWPSLGDRPLDEQLELWRAGRPTLQTQISLENAARDGQARRLGQPGVRYEPLIANHFLLMDRELSEEILASRLPTPDETRLRLSAQPNTKPNDKPNAQPIAKWKIRPDTMAETVAFLNRVSTHQPQWRWRLDGNALFSADAMAEFWGRLSVEARRQIDFIEDPCPYERGLWNHLETLGLPLAIDFEISRWLETGAAVSPTDSGQTVFVLKPAVQRMTEWQERLRAKPHPYMITSYLDHPVGLLHALWWAETLAVQVPDQRRCCGLSLSLTTDTLAQMGADFPRQRGPNNAWTGTPAPGIGLTSYLGGLTWLEL